MRYVSLKQKRNWLHETKRWLKTPTTADFRQRVHVGGNLPKAFTIDKKIMLADELLEH